MAEKTRPVQGSDDAVGTKAVGTAPHKTPATQSPRPLPPWKVILHNDDKNVFEDVVRVIRRLTPLTAREAFERTREAHETGAALLLMTHRERAELYVDQFASCGLTVTAEADA